MKASLGAGRDLKGLDPVGQRILIGAEPGSAEIVGIVADMHQALETDPRPGVFRPFAQSPLSSAAFAVRTVGDPLQLVHAISGQVFAYPPRSTRLRVRHNGRSHGNGGWRAPGDPDAAGRLRSSGYALLRWLGLGRRYFLFGCAADERNRNSLCIGRNAATSFRWSSDTGLVCRWPVSCSGFVAHSR